MAIYQIPLSNAPASAVRGIGYRLQIQFLPYLNDAVDGLINFAQQWQRFIDGSDIDPDAIGGGLLGWLRENIGTFDELIERIRQYGIALASAFAVFNIRGAARFAYRRSPLAALFLLIDDLLAAMSGGDSFLGLFLERI